MRKIVFLRNGITDGGLGIVCSLQANYFNMLGFDVKVIVDQSYKKELLQKGRELFDPEIEIIFGLNSPQYLHTAPQVPRRSRKRTWFGGSISEYYDEFGELVKVSYHDSEKQRVKIVLPVVERYLSSLKPGDIVMAMETSLGWYLGNLQLPKGVAKIYQHHNQHFFLSPWIENAEKFDAVVFQTRGGNWSMKKSLAKRRI